jgi:hypothetical protein
MGRRWEATVIQVYESPVQVSKDGRVINPEPDIVIIDGIEYRKAREAALRGL